MAGLAQSRNRLDKVGMLSGIKTERTASMKTDNQWSKQEACFARANYSVLYLQPNFQKLCITMDPFLCSFTNVLSELKPIHVIFLPHFQSPIYRYAFAS